MEVNIDSSAGFCFGVLQTIKKAESSIKKTTNKNIYVLGEIIHNPHEIKRLNDIGLKTISVDELDNLKQSNSIVIIRAHGEPPPTYKTLDELELKYFDATCPLVKKLQNKIIAYYKNDFQIIIFGKADHPEVVGLRGVCDDKCIVSLDVNDLMNKIDLKKETVLISQTTMSSVQFLFMYDTLLLHFKDKKMLHIENTICKFMVSREKKLKKFATENELIIFVAGRNSSNGKVLYNVCKDANENTIFIEDINKLNRIILENYNNIGITGATSTPMWYLETIKEKIMGG